MPDGKPEISMGAQHTYVFFFPFCESFLWKQHVQITSVVRCSRKLKSLKRASCSTAISGTGTCVVKRRRDDLGHCSCKRCDNSKTKTLHKPDPEVIRSPGWVLQRTLNRLNFPNFSGSQGFILQGAQSWKSLTSEQYPDESLVSHSNISAKNCLTIGNL